MIHLNLIQIFEKLDNFKENSLKPVYDLFSDVPLPVKGTVVQKM